MMNDDEWCLMILVRIAAVSELYSCSNESSSFYIMMCQVLELIDYILCRELQSKKPESSLLRMEKWGNLLTLLEHGRISVVYFVVFSDSPEVLLVLGVFNNMHRKARRDFTELFNGIK